MNKGSQLNKESGVSNEQGSQLNKESGVSNEQGVSAEQGVTGLNKGSQLNKDINQ